MTLLIVPNDANLGQVVELPVPGRADPVQARILEVPIPVAVIPAVQSSYLAPSQDVSFGTINNTLAASVVVPLNDIQVAQLAMFNTTNPAGTTMGMFIFELNPMGTTFVMLGQTAEFSVSSVNRPQLQPLLAPVALTAGQRYYFGIWASTVGVARVFRGAAVANINTTIAWFRNLATYADAAQNQSVASVTGNTVAPWMMGRV